MLREFDGRCPTRARSSASIRAARTAHPSQGPFQLRRVCPHLVPWPGTAARSAEAGLVLARRDDEAIAAALLRGEATPPAPTLAGATGQTLPVRALDLSQARPNIDGRRCASLRSTAISRVAHGYRSTPTTTATSAARRGALVPCPPGGLPPITGSGHGGSRKGIRRPGAGLSGTADARPRS